MTSELYNTGEEIVDKKFGQWVVVGGPVRKKGHVLSPCQCSCGKTAEVRVTKLVGGKSHSCGCARDKALTTHGRTKASVRKDSREYWIWNSMKQRCFNPKTENFGNYGGRGIAVCDRWLSFENFFADMGEKPEGKSLERLDNNGNYEPDNCVWADRTTQNSNKRNTRIIEANGERKTITQWARDSRISHATIIHRLKAGWTNDDAVSPERWPKKRAAAREPPLNS